MPLMSLWNIVKELVNFFLILAATKYSKSSEDESEESLDEAFGRVRIISIDEEREEQELSKKGDFHKISNFENFSDKEILNYKDIRLDLPSQSKNGKIFISFNNLKIIKILKINKI